MGDRLISEGEKPADEPRDWGDIFDEMFPHYLVMGMTPEQYWDGESGLKKAYRKAYKIRMETEARIADRNMWIQGMYIRDALASTPQFVAGFIPKGVRIPPYPDKSISEQVDENRKEEKRKENEQKQMKLAMAMLQAKFLQFNKRFEEQQKQKEKNAAAKA